MIYKARTVNIMLSAVVKQQVPVSPTKHGQITRAIICYRIFVMRFVSCSASEAKLTNRRDSLKFYNMYVYVCV